jgi:heptaprenyl diphosphate synthase
MRKDWPFLSRLTLGGRSAQSVTFRPALLLLLAKHFGTQDQPHFIEIAAALDLGYLAILAQSGIEDEPSTKGNGRDSNWGNKFCILLSDFLMAKCYELSGPISAEVSQHIARALTQTCTAHLQQMNRGRQLDITVSEYIDHLNKKFATMFELPCILGAQISGATWASKPLADYGRNLGVAYVLTEDVLLVASPEGKVGSALASDLSRGVLSLPIIVALQKEHSEAEHLRSLLSVSPMDIPDVIQAVRRAQVLQEVRAIATDFQERAKRSLSMLPAGPARIALERLADYATSRNVRQRSLLAVLSE